MIADAQNGGHDAPSTAAPRWMARKRSKRVTASPWPRVNASCSGIEIINLLTHIDPAQRPTWITSGRLEPIGIMETARMNTINATVAMRLAVARRTPPRVVLVGRFGAGKSTAIRSCRQPCRMP